MLHMTSLCMNQEHRIEEQVIGQRPISVHAKQNDLTTKYFLNEKAALFDFIC